MQRCTLYEHSKLGAWADAAYTSGLGNVLEGSWSHFHEELAFFKSFPDSERFHPLSRPLNPKILSKFHNLGTSCNTLIWLGPAGSILGALKAIVNVIGMTKMTPPIKETDDDWDWMPCCGRNGRMRDVSRVCNLCKKYAKHEQLKKQAVVATTLSFGLAHTCLCAVTITNVSRHLCEEVTSFEVGWISWFVDSC